MRSLRLKSGSTVRRVIGWCAHNRISAMLAMIAAASLAGAVNVTGAVPTIGVKFVGESGQGDILALTDVAGVVAQTNWNNIAGLQNSGGSSTGATGFLTNSTGTTNVVTLSYTADDSWVSDGGIATPDQRLMKGIIKSNPHGVTVQPTDGSDTETFVLKAVPAGAYDVYLYACENGTGAKMGVTLGSTTYYILEENVFTNIYIKASSTDPTSYTDANFALFSNVSPATNGTITITCVKLVESPQVNDGTGVAAIQIVPAGTPIVASRVVQLSSTSTVPVGGTATFNVVGVISGPPSYQWLKNGTNIPGATLPTFSFTASQADVGAQISALVYSGSVSNLSASFALAINTNTPSVVKVGAVQNVPDLQVGVTFDVPLSLSTATNKANYSLAVGTVTSASYNPGVPGVLLTVTGWTSSTNTVTVSGVANLFGAVMPASQKMAFVLGPPSIALSDADIGPANVPGLGSLSTNIDAFVGGAVYTIVGSGDDIWNSADSFHYAWISVTNDFDYVVNVLDLQGPDTWSKAELMARQEIDPTVGPDTADPFTATMTTRIAGQNLIEPQWRDTRGGAPGNGPAASITPRYPSTWLRLTRSGNLFTYKASIDGAKTWVSMGTHTEPASDWNNAPYIGMAVTAHNAGDTNGAIAKFSSFMPFVPIPVGISNQPPATVTGLLGRPFSLSVTATGDPINYQWAKGGVDITNANASTYSIAVTHPSDAGTYTVRVFNGANSVTSSNSVVTLIPYPPIPLVGAMKQTGGSVQVGVTFDEAINVSTLVAGNFSLNTGTISSLSVASNSFGTYFAAVLNTTGVTPGGSYVLTIKNVADLNAAAITSTNVNFTVGQYAWSETGTPVAPGQVVPVGATGFDVLNGGRQEWSTYDEVTMAYMVKTNDFDVKVQVVYAEPGSQWSRVGMQARNGLDIGEPITDRTNGAVVVPGDGLGGSTASAYVQTHVNPAQTLASSGLWPTNDPIQPVNPTPNNSHEQNTRPTAGANTQGWGSASTAPTYPNAWLRLARVGTNIFGYRGTDGVTWTAQGSTSLLDQTNVMFVAVSLGVETGNIWPAGANIFGPYNPTYDRLFLAQFRNFTDVVTGLGPLTATASGTASVTISWTGAGTLQKTGSLAPKAWADVSGVSGTSYTTSTTNGPAFFRLRQ